MRSNYEALIIALIFVGSACTPSGNQVLQTGGQAGSACTAAQHNEGCYYHQRMRCEDGVWAVISSCGDGEFCAEQKDPNGPGSTTFCAGSGTSPDASTPSDAVVITPPSDVPRVDPPVPVDVPSVDAIPSPDVPPAPDVPSVPDGPIEPPTDCAPGQTENCTTLCETPGVMVCSEDYTWGACVGGEEICGDGIDNDCDGDVDEGCGACSEDDTQPCETLCGTTGSQACIQAEGTLMWGPCVPPAEVCGDDVDNNCDNVIDEGCQTCGLEESQACLTSCNSTGKQFCVENDTGGTDWSECVPPKEICNGKDDDCDGQQDEGLQPTKDPYEPNEGCTSGVPLPEPVAIDGSLPHPEDVDWYQVPLTKVMISTGVATVTLIGAGAEEIALCVVELELGFPFGGSPCDNAKNCLKASNVSAEPGSVTYEFKLPNLGLFPPGDLMWPIKISPKETLFSNETFACGVEYQLVVE